MTRARLDTLRDRLWVLACAIQDVEGDLARLPAGPLDPALAAAEYGAALHWLLDAARPLVGSIDE